MSSAVKCSASARTSLLWGSGPQTAAASSSNSGVAAVTVRDDVPLTKPRGCCVSASRQKKVWATLVARQFFSYLEKTAAMPAWERPNMMAKYFVTTKGVEMSREPA